MPSDLIALVADKNMEYAIRGILARHQSLGVRPVDREVYVHPERDPGCLRRCEHFLRPFAGQFERAIVMFDREGCGRDAASRDELESDVERRLAATGWGNRSAAIVVDPELENWVWSESPHVDDILGWSGVEPTLRDWLVTRGYLTQESAKPDRPKEAMESALQAAQVRRSSSLYRELASRVSLTHCADPAFLKLRSLLQAWFAQN